MFSKRRPTGELIYFKRHFPASEKLGLERVAERLEKHALLPPVAPRGEEARRRDSSG